MKKPLILFISLLIAIGIGFYIHQSTQTKPSFQEVTIVDNEETTEPDSVEEPPEELEEIAEEEATEEEESQPSPFSDFIVKAAQNTIQFFSNRETKITAIGDSLTQGVGAVNEEGGYVGILDQSSINQNSLLQSIISGKEETVLDKCLNA